MPVVTSLYAAVFGLMLVLLSLEVIRLRRKHGVALQGLGNNKFVNRAVRIHGNFTEHVPLAVVLLLLMELASAPATLLHAVGMTLLVGRVAHAAGLKRSSGPTLWRGLGIGLTLATLIFEAIWLLGVARGR